MTVQQIEGLDWVGAALSSPVVSDQIVVEGCAISYRQWGDPERPGVVFVHGGGAHSRWWDHIGPLLADRYSIVALDLSGHGDSGRRPSYRWSLWAEELLQISAVATPSKQLPVIVAHSMGGKVAMTAASQASDALRGVILLDTILGGFIAHQQVPTIRDPKRLHPIYPTKEMAVARFRLRPRQPVAVPEVLRHIAETSVREVDGGWTWKFDPNTYARPADIGPEELAKITCDVVLIRCENGRIDPAEQTWLSSTIGTRVPMVELPLAYHSAMVDQPIALVSMLRAIFETAMHRPVR